MVSDVGWSRHYPVGAQVIKGSHDLGRLSHGLVGGQQGVGDMERVTAIRKVARAGAVMHMSCVQPTRPARQAASLCCERLFTHASLPCTGGGGMGRR